VKRQIARGIGAVGALLVAGVYIHEPSFPTPDKLLVFLTFVFMAFGQGWEFFKRLAPFVGLLLAYESFRGVADHLNAHVNYTFMIHADKILGFGELPTRRFQGWLWSGHVQWYDFVIYLFYMLHFVLPFTLALIIWKKRESQYWRYITAFILVSFAGFLTFLAFPAAPPWLASDNGIIQPIAHISSYVWQALGVHDFPSVYNKISPNIVAAMPSLHAAYATLLSLFAIKLFDTRWRWLILIHPIMIYFGTVYTGEHYIIDEIAGILYGLAAFYASPWVAQHAGRGLRRFHKRSSYLWRTYNPLAK
jgi:hypothetical protein